MSKTQTLYVVQKYNYGDIHKVNKQQTKHTRIWGLLNIVLHMQTKNQT